MPCTLAQRNREQLSRSAACHGELLSSAAREKAALPKVGAALLGLAALITALCMILYVQAAQAAERMTVRQGTGITISVSRPAASIFVGDASVADIEAVSDEAFFVSGISPGTTNVFALDANDDLIMNYTIVVVADSTEARELAAQSAPAGNIQVQDAGNVAVIRGTAKSVGEAVATLEVERALSRKGRQTSNRTSIASPVQVSLRVRFAEIARDDLFRLGVDFSAIDEIGGETLRIVSGTGLADAFASVAGGGTAGNVSVDVVLDALERVGVVQILSEPTLTTVSGKRAKFRAGGDVAFPVNQGDGVFTAEYRETGVSVDFLPTVLPNKRIAIEVKPEVTFVDNTAGTEISGFNAPNFSVRSAETTVEVASGQTFAIAGLYEQYASDVDSGVPGLRRAPLVGSAFNNRSQERNERELIIFITPLLVDASDAANRKTERQVPTADRIGFILK